MAWGDVQSDKATDKQIQYAEILLERLHGDINYPIYSMNKREISVLIDDTKNKLMQKGIDWHEPNVPSVPFTTHNVQAETIDTSHIYATAIDQTLATTPLRREDIQNAINILEENRRQGIRMREEMRRRGLEQWFVGEQTIVEPTRRSRPTLEQTLRSAYYSTEETSNYDNQLGSILTALLRERMFFNRGEVIVSSEMSYDTHEYQISLRHRPTQRATNMSISFAIVRDRRFDVVANKLEELVDRFVHDVEEHRARTMSQESRQLNMMERARNWFFGGHYNGIATLNVPTPYEPEPQRGDDNVNTTANSNRTI